MTVLPALADDPPAARLAEAIGRRARRLVLVAVVLLAAIGWGWLLAAAAGAVRVADMGPGGGLLAPALGRLASLVPGLAGAGGHGLLMPAMTAWGPGDVALVFLMWTAMVFAMMVPTAAPTFRAHARTGRAVAGVIAGYAAVWIGAAVAFTAGQAGLVALGALAPHMAPAGLALTASILLAAGVYQFTPLKAACLSRCRRAPVALLEAGDEGMPAVRIGVEEGLACLGCCWALMTVSFAAGLMNLPAMALLGAMMGIEKASRGVLVTNLLGFVLSGAGVLLAAALFIG